MSSVAVPSLPERARAQRRARTVRRAAAGTLAAAVLGLLGWVVLLSPLLAVDRVQVTGEGRVTEQQVLAAAAVVPGTPLARVDTGEVGRRVAALRPVERVEVARGWPGTLRLKVVERAAAVWVSGEAGVTLLDRTGVAFATEPRQPPGAVRLQVERPGPRDPSTRAALDVLADLPDALRARTAIVRAASPLTVSLLLRDGREVVWGPPERAEDKAAAAEALLRLPGTRYDVTSPDVVVRTERTVASG